MKPDRILLAELRAEEAFDYLRNVNSGHPGSITSVHAASAELAFEQLVLLVKQSRRRTRTGARRHQESPVPADRHRDPVRRGSSRAIHQGDLVRPGAQARARRGRGGRLLMNSLFAHGWSGLALAYACVQGPLVAGLIRGGAEVRKISGIAHSGRAPDGCRGSAAPRPRARRSPARDGPRTARFRRLWDVAVSAAVGYSAGRAAAGRRSESRVHQRGAVVADGAPNPSASSPARQIQLPSATAPADACRHPVPIDDETKHFKFIGTTGTGKSTAIQERARVRAGPRRPGGHCRSGRRLPQAALRRGRGDVVLNPFDERSVKWDLFAEIKNAYDVDQLARSLIPGPGRRRSQLARLRTHLLQRRDASGARGRHPRSRRAVPAAGGRRRRGAADAGERHAGPAVPGGAQQPHVRFRSVRSRVRRSPHSITSASSGAADFRYATG